jgi:uncharacterized coiled-coil DUF342 family protein
MTAAYQRLVDRNQMLNRQLSETLDQLFAANRERDGAREELEFLNRQLAECAEQRDAALTEVERLSAEVQRLARELDHRDADPPWTKRHNWFAELREGL